MKYAEIQKMDPKELQAKIKQEKELLSKLSFTHKINPIEKPSRIKQSRRLVARLKTAQNNPIKTEKKS